MYTISYNKHTTNKVEHIEKTFNHVSRTNIYLKILCRAAQKGFYQIENLTIKKSI